MAPFDQLSLARSQTAIGLMAYLQSFVDLRVAGWRFPLVYGRSPMDLFQVPDVVRRDRLDAPARQRRQQAALRGEFATRDDRSIRPVEWLAVRAELQRESVPPGRPRVAVVLGRPGEGKTLLTQLTCRDVARVGLQALVARAQPLEEIDMPVWLTINEVIEAGSLTETIRRVCRRQVDAALGRDGSSSQAVSDGACAHLDAAMQRRSTWLFLDALDERDERADVRTALGELGTFPGRVVLTGRPYAYEPHLLPCADGDITELELTALRPAQQRTFINRWFENDPVHVGRVSGLIESHATLSDMSRNGLLLTLICATAERHPVDAGTTRRVHLYDWAVADLVRRARSARPLPVDSPELARRLLVLPRAASTLFNRRSTQTVFSYREWHAALQSSCHERGIANAARFTQALTDDLVSEGLLVTPARGQWTFLHRTFYEYLSAAGVAWDHSAVTDVVAAHVGSEQWRDLSLFALAHVSLIQQRPDAASAVVEEILRRDAQRSSGTAVEPSVTGTPGEAVALIGEAVADIAPDGRSAGDGVTADCRERVIAALLREMRADARVAVGVRVSCGNMLAKLGDPRFLSDAWWLPTEEMLGFVEIPGGSFMMGSDLARDRWAYRDELPAHPLTVQRFFLQRFPVTLAQFRAFVADVGRAEPFAPSDPRCLSGVANHPVAFVSWREALRYGAWLTERLRTWRETPDVLRGLIADGWVVTLPTEAQWERAARGRHGWIFPWGDTWTLHRANSTEERIATSSPVGCFPGGATPQLEGAIEELLGNVCEWTRSRFKKYPYDANDGRDDLRGNVMRVVRGGSFLDRQYKLVRSAARYSTEPDGQPWAGFRVALCRL